MTALEHDFVESLRPARGLLKRVDERLIHSACSLPHTQLAGPICRNEAGVFPGALDLYQRVACGGVNQLGMQQAAVAGSSATSRPQRNFSAVSERAGDFKERLTEAEVHRRTGGMDQDFRNCSVNSQ